MSKLQHILVGNLQKFEVWLKVYCFYQKHQGSQQKVAGETIEIDPWSRFIPKKAISGAKTHIIKISIYHHEIIIISQKTYIIANNENVKKRKCYRVLISMILGRKKAILLSNNNALSMQYNCNLSVFSLLNGCLSLYRRQRQIYVYNSFLRATYYPIPTKM